MNKYRVTWYEKDDKHLEREDVVVDADSALQAEVIVAREYGVKRGDMKVKRVA